MSVPFEVDGAHAAVISCGRGNGRAIEFSIRGVDGPSRMSGAEAHALITVLAQALVELTSDHLSRGVCRGCCVRRVASPCFGVTENGGTCYRMPADE